MEEVCRFEVRLPLFGRNRIGNRTTAKTNKRGFVFVLFCVAFFAMNARYGCLIANEPKRDSTGKSWLQMGKLVMCGDRIITQLPGKRDFEASGCLPAIFRPVLE